MTQQPGLGARIVAALGGAVRGKDRRTTPARRSPAKRPVRSPTWFEVEYAPQPDGLPDPGEVVWTWVPYEEDASQGKDRPVLIVGRRDGALVGLMLTSKDHDRDAEQEAREGRHWMDVGTGGWDRLRRPSEVRLDRLLTIKASAVRREGAALDPKTFDAVVTHLRSR